MEAIDTDHGSWYWSTHWPTKQRSQRDPSNSCKLREMFSTIEFGPEDNFVDNLLF